MQYLIPKLLALYMALITLHNNINEFLSKKIYIFTNSMVHSMYSIPSCCNYVLVQFQVSLWLRKGEFFLKLIKPFLLIKVIGLSHVYSSSITLFF